MHVSIVSVLASGTRLNAAAQVAHIRLPLENLGCREFPFPNRVRAPLAISCIQLPAMDAVAQPVAKARTATRTNVRSVVIVILAVALPVLAGLAWHLASDNPAWPLMRSSMNLCSLSEAQLSPVSPDGLFQVHVVRATWLDRFDETLVFLSPADEPWPLRAANPDRAVLEVAGARSLDAITWQAAQAGQSPVLQLWIAPGAAPNQIHRVDRTWRNVLIETLTSQPAAGAERLAY